MTYHGRTEAEYFDLTREAASLRRTIATLRAECQRMCLDGAARSRAHHAEAESLRAELAEALRKRDEWADAHMQLQCLSRQLAQRDARVKELERALSDMLDRARGILAETEHESRR